MWGTRRSELGLSVRSGLEGREPNQETIDVKIGQISQISISQNGNFPSVESRGIHVILHRSIVVWANIKREFQSIALKEKYSPLQCIISTYINYVAISTMAIVEHRFQTRRDHAVRLHAFSGSHWRHHLHHCPACLQLFLRSKRASQVSQLLPPLRPHEPPSCVFKLLWLSVSGLV